MSLLIACISSNDPSIPSLVEGIQKAGPILQTLRKNTFSQVLLLASPETLGKLPLMEAALKHEMPHIFLESKVLSIEEGFSYATAFNSLKNATINYQTHSKPLYFLPNNDEPIWHTAAVFLFTSGYLKGQVLNSPSQLDFEDLSQSQEMKGTPSSALSISTKPEFFIDDVAYRCGLIGKHPRFKEALQTASALAPHDTPVLILGETGSGKDGFARFVHAMSGRADQNFVAVNCATLPEGLAESILFGHTKGAFTGAVSNQNGIFKQAHGGTLFLDELGELPLKIQAKLLRVIENGIIDPLGAQKPEQVSVRLIAATNKNLLKLIQEGSFREDLYYRLRVGELHLPPLRERTSDIHDISLFLLKQINRSLKEARKLHPATLEALETHPWPGNIRDLQNVLERAAILSPHALLKPEDLRLCSYSIERKDIQLPELSIGFSLEDYLAELRTKLIHKALEQARGNQSEAARLLGISAQAVNRFVRQKEELVKESSPTLEQRN